MATTFRLCTAADTSLLAWLVLDWHAAEGVRLDGSFVRGALRPLLRDTLLGHAWIIEQDGLAAGYVILSLSGSGHAFEPRAEITALYLAPEFRGRGLGHRARQFLRDVGAALRLPVAPTGIEDEARHSLLFSRAEDHNSRRVSAMRHDAVA
jgi:GNAT superfamily N-acetyltransferase